MDTQSQNDAVWIPFLDFNVVDNYLVEDDSFPIDTPDNELQYGFIQAVIPHPQAHYGNPHGIPNPTHMHVLIAPLGNGLIAVKTKIPDNGGIRYGIWNEQTLKSVDDYAVNLNDLHSKYPSDRYTPKP